LSQGPVVLIFYRFDFGPIWGHELSQFRDAHYRFRELGAQLLAISLDSIFAHKAFLQKLQLPFPLLSDFAREVATAYGVLNPGVDARGYKGAIIRSVFVVDHTRTICYRYLSEDPAQLPDVEEVLEAVREVVEAEYH
jgi:glutaredoxin-dependent peroxiredoxin